MRRTYAIASLVVLTMAVAGAGCSKSETPGGQAIRGPVDSEVQGEGRTAVLLWEVSSGSPDYVYKFGEGTVANGRFSIALPGNPPADAINSFGVGIAIIVVLPAGKTLADGKLAANAFTPDDMAGVSTRYSVIWRAQTLSLPSTAPEDFWPFSFPPGYACGACTPKPDGGSFEGFAPTSCDQIQITTYDIDQMCNWT
jgi:hypothetical protein